MFTNQHNREYTKDNNIKQNSALEELIMFRVKLLKGEKLHAGKKYNEEAVFSFFS